MALSKTVLELQEKVETHCFEFKIPPRSSLKKKFSGCRLTSSSHYCENLQVSDGIFYQQNHTLVCSIAGNKISLTLELPVYINNPTRVVNCKIDHFVIDLISNEVTKASNKVKVTKSTSSNSNKNIWVAQWNDTAPSVWVDSIDTIRVLIRFTMEEEKRKILESSTESKINEAASKKTNTFATDLFLSESLSDVKLICGNQRFPAHRAILYYKSPVFKSMFEHGMKESLEGRVVIEDFEPEIVKEMLRHIYTGKAELTPNVQVELFKAAEKYNLENLKNECVQKISMSISAGNAVEVYALGTTYNSELLCEAAFEIIKENKGVIAGNPEKFQELNFRFPELMFRLFIQC